MAVGGSVPSGTTTRGTAAHSFSQRLRASEGQRGRQSKKGYGHQGKLNWVQGSGGGGGGGSSSPAGATIRNGAHTMLTGAGICI